MKATIRTGIIGGAGYTGGELIRLLLQHPDAELTFVHSKSNAGGKLYQVHEDLIGSTEQTFTDNIHQDIDVLFLCLGHGESSKFLQENQIDEKTKVIDLANDFRLKENACIGKRNFIYGLPALNLNEIKSANNIANPGCFATAIQLGLLPLAANGLINEVHTTGITGSTGAGQSLTATSHFSWRENNIQAYKTLTHQHLGEIHQSLHQVSSKDASVHFVPWRGDFTRGIFISSTLNCHLTLDEANSIFNNYHSADPFIIVSKKQISLKQVVNTNKAVIHLEKQGEKLVVHSAIDNLLKGASGQAVQNMNIMFGLDQVTGLQLKPSAF